ncbi:cell division protein FtsQ/DivIB [Polynucleobacter sp. MG-6-Vaara-E2]|jgi:cell division protein FtsQ|uniref:cell division protein FtsQ/DivIB n=1 Tax=Polynucleobacter sp. MG-6-Vaara-E2 TaxID=2576932 RepID=UPI001BFDB7AB|nr:cell division protein FtsQ/DivIB [Polynucleobacter sp. MG-6-Vaara-E2]QWD96768.1 cell division protein FtsQ/DivIB [Polynucleobacter sp. MG-6-Vaara-E2]
MSNFMDRFGEIFAMLMSPIWNYPDRMQKLSRFLLRCFVVMMVFGVLVWLSQRPVFALKQIQIEPVVGQTLKHINKSLVKQQVLETVQGNFFSVRLEDVKRGFESMPWVRHANVRRVWPNGLIVSIEEQRPFGTWGGAESHELINNHGEVFAGRVSEVSDDVRLIDFHGPEDAGREVMSLYEKANNWFKPWGAEVTSLALTERYAWHIKLSNGMKVEFGRDEESSDKTLTEERVARLFKYWPQVQEKWSNRIDAVDLRYANGFAVHLAAASVKKNDVDGKKSELKQ